MKKMKINEHKKENYTKDPFALTKSNQSIKVILHFISSWKIWNIIKRNKSLMRSRNMITMLRVSETRAAEKTSTDDES